MKRTNIILLSVIPLFGMGLQACSDDNTIFKGEENCDGIYFSLSVDKPAETTRSGEQLSESHSFVIFDNAEMSLDATVSDISSSSDSLMANSTRAYEDNHALEITTENIHNYKNIYLFSRARKKDKDDDRGEVIQENLEVPILGNERPYCHIEQTWPTNGITMFYHAFALPEDAMVSYSVGDEADQLIHTTITVPERQSEQYDFVAAIAQINDYPTESGRIPLRFNHMLTQVCIDFSNFVWEDAERKQTYTFENVERVEIENLRYTGTMKFCAIPGFEKEIYNLWSYVDKKKTVYWDKKEMSEKDDVISFMVLPQDVDNSNSIKGNNNFGYLDNVNLKIKIEGIEGFKTANLKTSQIQRWEKGKKYTYRVKNGTSIFEVSPSEVYCGYKGTTGSLVINSKNKDGAVDYSVEYSNDGGSSWTSTGVNGLTFDKSTSGFTVSEQTGKLIDASEHNKRLRSNPFPGTAGVAYDLSTEGGKKNRNTANCYIVNAAGTYEFPLVYGNGVKNGYSNVKAYTTSVEGNNVLKRFTNHLGKGITDPYIYYNAGCEPATAELVWEDTNDLIQEVKLSDNKEMLVFKTADKGSISVGNAVVAVKDAKGQIMWSWHIWITDFESGAVSDIPVECLEYEYNTYNRKYTDNVVAEHAYRFMGQNIGTCDLKTTEYVGREFQLRFTQKGTGLQRIVRFIQRPFIKMETPGDQPFFQWGRKDPMPPSNGKNYGIKLADGYKFNPSKTKASIQQGILNPLTMYSSAQSNWCNTDYVNLWSSNTNSVISSDMFEYEIGVKTIYDPSPVGYVVPPNGVYSFVTFKGNGVESKDITSKTPFNELINTPLAKFEDAEDYSGWLFYTKPMDESKKIDPSSETILFAGTGYRFYNSGDVYYYNKLTWCWSSTPGTYEYGRMLYCAYCDSPIDKRVAPAYGNYRSYGLIVRPIREQ